MSGLLLYFNGGEAKSIVVQPTWADVKALLILRNSLAMYMHKGAISTGKQFFNYNIPRFTFRFVVEKILIDKIKARCRHS